MARVSCCNEINWIPLQRVWRKDFHSSKWLFVPNLCTVNFRAPNRFELGREDGVGSNSATPLYGEVNGDCISIGLGAAAVCSLIMAV